MSEPRVTEKARNRPKFCFLTNQTDGPFLDLGVEIPEHREWHGYLSLKYITPALRDYGFIAPEQADDLLAAAAEADEWKSRAKAAEEKLEAVYAELAEIQPPRVIENEVVKVERRQPLEEEIYQWIQAHKEEYRKMLEAPVSETEAWNRLYRSQEEAKQAEEEAHALYKLDGTRIDLVHKEAQDAKSAEARQALVEENDQNVDVLAVLDNSVEDVLIFAAGRSEEVLGALLAEETAGRDRKTLTEGLAKIIAKREREKVDA